jgi:histidine triad (HIT) family protein
VVGAECAGGAQSSGRLKMKECLFCRIVDRTAPGTIAFEDDRLLAFQDTRPQAPLHVLVVPKRHIESLNSLDPEDDALVGEMIRRAAAIASERGYGERGYRTVFNCNRDAGQSVYHIHLHLLAGRPLGWPPG